jgi:Na+/melibiose symporter-like transporter
MVLNWSGYVSNSSTQTPSAVLAIRILMGPEPSVLLVAGILFAAFYPLNRAGHLETRVKIDARRAAKEK